MSAPAQPQASGAGGASSQALLTDTDYENMTIQWNDCEDYEIIRKVGRGKYSEVFEGWRVSGEEKVIIKCLKPVRQRKIKREIKILQVGCRHPAALEECICWCTHAAFSLSSVGVIGNRSQREKKASELRDFKLPPVCLLLCLLVVSDGAPMIICL